MRALALIPTRSDRYPALHLSLCRALEKLHQRGAILYRADALLGHLGARGVGRRSDLEQSGNRLRRPDNIEALECFGKIIARHGCDPSAEDAGQGWARPVCLLGAKGVAGDTGTKHLRTMVAGIGGERISRRLQENWIEGFSRHRVPATDD